MNGRSPASSIIRGFATGRIPVKSCCPRRTATAGLSTSSRHHRLAPPAQNAAASTAADASSFASESYIPPPIPPFYPPSSSDDASIKAHFDLARPTLSGPSRPAGLLDLNQLTSPGALRPLTDRTLVHAQRIVDRISAAPSDPTGRELRRVVKNLDRLSDLLCGVIDMCELVRTVHPDKSWVAECERAYERLCNFLNGLNTDRGMYEALVQTVNHTFAVPLSSAETQVALTFLRDFEKSGIHLPPSVRARFVELSDALLTTGRTFLSSATSGPTSDPIVIPDPDRLLANLGPRFIASLPRRRGKAYVMPGSREASIIARRAGDTEARRLAYVGAIRADPERIEVLETLLRQRAELANVLGKDTWAEVVLTDKMAKTPANATRFLSSLVAHNRPAAAANVAALQRVKASTVTGNHSTSRPGDASTLSAWDRDYYTDHYLLSLSPTSSLPPISPYFSVGTVLLGLSRLFSRLYGISFRPVPVDAGESWHPSVRRLDVMDEAEGQIGVIYCDLFSRPGKSPSGAHYTVRCSRRVDDDDPAGDGLAVGWDEAFGPGLETDGVPVEGREGRYQLPIVVLSTDFGSYEDGRPVLLGWGEVETLFHEMGHAIHSMIGRTEYHNVSGTRCPTDFVELPSILMEHFVSSPSVLSLFATHHVNGEPLPLPLLKAHMINQQALAALDTHGQILMAILDQQYHSLRLSDFPTFDSTRMHADVHNTLGVIPAVDGTAWQTQFGHLYGYGATYYSYLFDRAIAGKVWSTLFSGTPDDSLSREGGEVFKQKVLKWGGGKDPWEMVGSIVGGAEGDAVAKGDEGAMGLVGGWLNK